MLKYISLLLFICTGLSTNFQTLSTIKDCTVSQSTTLVTIRCIEKKNLSGLPEIPANLTSNLHIAIFNRRIPLLPNTIYKDHKVKLLSLKENAIEVVSPASFRALFPSTLEELFLSMNKIQTIDAIFSNNSFSQNCRVFASLRRLSLDNNQISAIKSTSFECLTRLEELSLYSNRIASIDGDSLQQFQRLGTLLLSSNLLTSLDFLKKCNSPLVRLSLGFNSVSIRESSRVFENFKALNWLEINANNLTCVDDETLRGLTSLNQLDLSNNNIKSVAPNSFSYFARLRYLFLVSNWLIEINPEIFKKNFLISTLNLRSNMISAIRSGDFLYLSSLSSLDLSNNNISEIQNGSFKLSFLSDLDLSFNKLTNISLEMVTGLAALKSLYLSDNRIARIWPNTIESLQLINTLDLRNNLIQSLDLKLPRSIRSLYIQNNLIEYINPKAFELSLSLSLLELTNNRLKFLENNMFANLYNMKTYFFNNNSISAIGSNVFRVDVKGPGFGTLEFDLDRIIFKHNNLKSIPSNLKNISVVSLDLSYNNIVRVERASFENIKYLQSVFCSHNKIHSVDSGAFNGMFAKVSIIDFSSNQITKIEMLNQRYNLVSIMLLVFEKNQIESIAENAFNWLNVSRLSLVDNPIKHIHPRITDDLARLSFVFFSRSILIDLDTKVIVEAFSPNRVIKKNVYKFYKAIFFIAETNLYDNTLCNVTFELLKNKILLNLEDIDKVELVLTKCSVVDDFSNFLLHIN